MRRMILVGVLATLITSCFGQPSGGPSGVHAWQPTTHPSDLVVDQTARDQFRQRAQPLYDAVTADPNNFAGIYSTDEGGRWRIVVRFLGDAPLADVMKLAADDIPVDWVVARYSMAELNSVFADLTVELGPDIQAKRISQITPDEASNTVMVGLPDAEPALQKALVDRYGDMVSFQSVPLFEPIP